MDMLSRDSSGSHDGIPEMRLILVGNMGCGKTATANTLLTEGSSTSTPEPSRRNEVRHAMSEGRRLKIVETPRWYWSGTHIDTSVQRETERALSLLAPGPHAFLILVPVGQFTQMDGRIPSELERVFGRGALQHTLVLLTCGDYLIGRDHEQYIMLDESGLSTMVNECGGRWHVINNRRPEDRQQVISLLEKVEQLTERGGGCYLPSGMQSEKEHELQRSYSLQEKGLVHPDRSMLTQTTWSKEETWEESGRRGKFRVRSMEPATGRLASQQLANGLHSQPWYDDSPVELKEKYSTFKLSKEGAILSQMSETEQSDRNQNSQSFINTIHYQISTAEDTSSAPPSLPSPTAAITSYSPFSSLRSATSSSSSFKAFSTSSSTKTRPSCSKTFGPFSSSNISYSSTTLPSSLTNAISSSSNAIPSTTTNTSFFTSSNVLPSSSALSSSFSDSNTSSILSSTTVSSSSPRTNLSFSSSSTAFSSSSPKTNTSTLSSSTAFSSSSPRTNTSSSSSSTVFSSSSPRTNASFSPSSTAISSRSTTAISSSTAISSRSTTAISSSTAISSRSTASSSSSFFSSSLSSSASSDELRLVLLGRAGSGKSAAGNAILGREEFKLRSDDATGSTTQSCVKGTAVIGKKRVAVVDTPDWFGPSCPPEKLASHLSSCMDLCVPGPHAFLLCVPVTLPGRSNLHDLGSIKNSFGPDAILRHTLVLFTHADMLKDGNVEEYIAAKRPELLELVEKCGDRYHVLNQGRNKGKIEELMEKLEQLVKENGGNHYVNLGQDEVGRERMQLRRGRAGEDDMDRAVSATLHSLMEEEEVEQEEQTAKPVESTTSQMTSGLSSVLRFVGQKLGEGAKQVPKLVAGGAVLGGVLGLYVGGPVGGAVGATAGSVAAEYGRRKYNKPKTD